MKIYCGSIPAWPACRGGLAGYWVNESPVGEIWMNAYTAGLQNVPFVFLGGDRAAAAEAQALVSAVEVAVVKEGLDEQARGLAMASALLLALPKAQAVIRAAAERAMAKLGTMAPYRPAPPFRLCAQFRDAHLAEQWAGHPGVKRLDEVTRKLEEVNQPWLLL